MKTSNMILLGVGALALFAVYKKKQGSTASVIATTTDPNTQAQAQAAWWNYAGSWSM